MKLASNNETKKKKNTMTNIRTKGQNDLKGETL